MTFLPAAQNNPRGLRKTLDELSVVSSGAVGVLPGRSATAGATGISAPSSPAT
jgi:hypothetical protein